MSASVIAQVFFVYGLAFFALGLAIALEVGRSSDERLRRAFGMLAIFGLVHGTHEWMEMYQGLNLLPIAAEGWQVLRVVVLAMSFLALTSFGVALWYRATGSIRSWPLVPLVQAGLWGGGLIWLRNEYQPAGEMWIAADVWSRYALAIPSALVAAQGLLALRRSFRHSGLERFGRDCMVAALAFVAYGAVGQLFTHSSNLPPSTLINDQLFLNVFGFPVQLLRAAAALVITLAIIRVMRSFEVERRQQLAELQEDRLREAERRQAMRGQLLNRVVQAQEAERERIARELHDETGQALTAIGLGLRGVAAKLEPLTPEMTEQLAHLEQMTKHSLDELQRMIAGLRPSHLDDLGLAAALRWFAGEVESHSPLATRVEIEGVERPLPEPISIGLFRVAQEALTNVVKHASAETARLRLVYRQDQVELEVTDDGVGFDTPGGDRPSWGLMGIQERVSLMGGEFELNSERGQGTQVRVVVPIEPESEQEHAHTAAVGG